MNPILDDIPPDDDDDSTPPLPLPPPPPDNAQPPPCRRRTEVELLGTPQDLGKCISRPTWKARENLPAPDPHPDHSDNVDTNNVVQNNIVQCLSTGLLNEPHTYRDAMNRPDADKWEEAVNKEFDALEKMNVLQECVLPPGQKAIGTWCVFRLKRNADGTVERYKCRLVAQGFTQKPGIDYFQTEAPVAKIQSIHLLLSLAVMLSLHIKQFDFDTTYLNGKLKEEIYIRITDNITGKYSHLNGKVFQLLRALYGLKQAGHIWNDTLDTEIVNLGYIRCNTDTCVYIYRKKEIIIFLAIYVNDCLMIGNSPILMEDHGKILQGHFKMRKIANSDSTQLFFILGTAFTYDRSARTISMCQERYIKDMQERYGLLDAKLASTPFAIGFKPTATDCPSSESEKKDMENIPFQSLISSLMYAANCTCPDIAYSVGALCKFTANPGCCHWNEAKWILRYLIATCGHSLTYHGDTMDLSQLNNGLIQVYADSDYARNVDNR